MFLICAAVWVQCDTGPLEISYKTDKRGNAAWTPTTAQMAKVFDSMTNEERAIAANWELWEKQRFAAVAIMMETTIYVSANDVAFYEKKANELKRKEDDKNEKRPYEKQPLKPRKDGDNGIYLKEVGRNKYEL